MTWLDIMPAISLARGVPVISVGHRVTAVVVSVERGTGRPLLACPGAMDDSPANPKSWRVDLGDPQGFAYALRDLADRYRGRTFEVDGVKSEVDDVCLDLVQALFRWRSGGPTDADRLALARACAEVAL